jgi:GTP pyrophosphokinase
MNKAFKIASKVHKNQTRKLSNLPYIYHPLQVADQLIKWGVKDQTLIECAYLHDVLEDCPKEEFDKYKDKINAISNVHLQIVLSLSIFSKDAKEESIKSLLYSKYEDAILIKYADRYCNLKDFQAQDPKYFPKYLAKSQIFFDRLEQPFISSCFTKVKKDFNIFKQGI